ncbi:MAG: hypothetical protein QG613_593, partial [Pseudomonadota bacterium]|nr:hypothetical protein [Pseudomonadota bacterium]
QVVTLNALRKDFTRQMLIFRCFSGIAAHSSLVIMPMLNDVRSANEYPCRIPDARSVEGHFGNLRFDTGDNEQ